MAEVGTWNSSARKKIRRWGLGRYIEKTTEEGGERAWTGSRDKNVTKIFGEEEKIGFSILT